MAMFMLAALAGCGRGDCLECNVPKMPTPLTIFAASSLKPAFDKLGEVARERKELPVTSSPRPTPRT